MTEPGNSDQELQKDESWSLHEPSVLNLVLKGIGIIVVVFLCAAAVLILRVALGHLYD